MNIIVAVDQNWGIGKNNDLLFHLPLDMQYFRHMTDGKVVVMGKNTLKSFPNSKPLKNRTNIVLSTSDEEFEGCITVHSLDELRTALKGFESREVFVVGGGMFYSTMLPFCDTAYITKVSADGEATVFFENLDTKEGWHVTEMRDEAHTNGYNITFLVYKNSNPQPF